MAVRTTPPISFNADIVAEFGGVVPHQLTEYYRGGVNVEDRVENNGVPLAGEISITDFYGASGLQSGEALFNTAGTRTWVCPDGVTSVCVVCVGGGGGGMFYNNSSNTYTYSMSGGGGGGLGWRNNIPVIPGQSYTVTVGAAGQSGAYLFGSTAGGDSFFEATTQVMGEGGNPGRYNSDVAGGGFVGDGGGNGGGTQSSVANGRGPAGGGGAGGYTGNGGDGRDDEVASGDAPAAGSGGGAGGGAATGTNEDHVSGGGGGVGIYGQGADGIPQTNGIGGGGSGGADGGSPVDGDNNFGGAYGGGGGGSSSTFFGNAADGGVGAVRIIWGDNRSFPQTNTDLASSVDVFINGVQQP